MTDHVWDGRPLGGRRRRYKIAGCSRSLFPRLGNGNPYGDLPTLDELSHQSRWTTTITDIDINEIERFRSHPDMPFEEYVQRFWEEEAEADATE